MQPFVYAGHVAYQRHKLRTICWTMQAAPKASSEHASQRSVVEHPCPSSENNSLHMAGLAGFHSTHVRRIISTKIIPTVMETLQPIVFGLRTAAAAAAAAAAVAVAAAAVSAMYCCCSCSVFSCKILYVMYSSSSSSSLQG